MARILILIHLIRHNRIFLKTIRRYIFLIFYFSGAYASAYIPKINYFNRRRTQRKIAPRLEKKNFEIYFSAARFFGRKRL